MLGLRAGTRGRSEDRKGAGRGRRYKAGGAAPHLPPLASQKVSVLIARRYFTGFIAELVEIPRADDHINLRYHL